MGTVTLSIEIQEGKVTPLVDVMESLVAALKLQPGFEEKPKTSTAPKKEWKEEKAEYPIKLELAGDGKDPANKAQCGAAYGVLKDAGIDKDNMAKAIGVVTGGTEVKPYDLTKYSKYSVSKLIAGLKQYDFSEVPF